MDRQGRPGRERSLSSSVWTRFQPHIDEWESGTVVVCPESFGNDKRTSERHPHDAIFSALGIRDPAEQCPRGVGVDDRGWDRKFRVLGA